jgi:SAM-dependent methyltransferase
VLIGTAFFWVFWGFFGQTAPGETRSRATQARLEAICDRALGPRWGRSRFGFSLTAYRAMSTPLYQRIQQFYDASSGLWEQIWGEHMHHGYYGPGGKLRKDRRIAQIDLIEELLAWAGVEQADCILDVGCGIGGSSLYLAAKYGAQVDGVTLSPVQAARATARSREAGFGDRARFQVADALHLPFADDTFDLVWSLESGEHMQGRVPPGVLPRAEARRRLHFGDLVSPAHRRRPPER